jgi:hypothetical protein
MFNLPFPLFLSFVFIIFISCICLVSLLFLHLFLTVYFPFCLSFLSFVFFLCNLSFIFMSLFYLFCFISFSTSHIFSSSSLRNLLFFLIFSSIPICICSSSFQRSVFSPYFHVSFFFLSTFLFILFFTTSLHSFSLYTLARSKIVFGGIDTTNPSFIHCKYFVSLLCNTCCNFLQTSSSIITVRTLLLLYSHNQNHFWVVLFCLSPLITLHLKERGTFVTWEKAGQ